MNEKFVSIFGETSDEDISELLATMFPALAKSQEIQVYHRGGTRILAGRRINDPNGFDAYFPFASVADEISVEQHTS
jgi:hypothetical protein